MVGREARGCALFVDAAPWWLGAAPVKTAPMATFPWVGGRDLGKPLPPKRTRPSLTWPDLSVFSKGPAGKMMVCGGQTGVNSEGSVITVHGASPNPPPSTPKSCRWVMEKSQQLSKKLSTLSNNHGLLSGPPSTHPIPNVLAFFQEVMP